MKRILPLLLLPAALLASEVSPDLAARAAKAWVDRGYAMGKLPAGRTVSAVDEVEDPATGAQLRVVKFEGGGYVVLSADDLVDPVIAFSETGDGIEIDDRNPFWALLRGDIAAREAAAGVERGKEAETKGGGTATRVAKSAEPTAAQSKWAALLAEGGPSLRKGSAVAVPSDLRVDSFVASRWGQHTHDNTLSGLPCYNYSTPNNDVTGCGATAFSQVMRYFSQPTSSVTARSYSCSVDGVAQNLTMIGGSYDWTAMPLRPAEGTPTEKQRAAIGMLLRDVGVAMNMQYGSQASSSYLACGAIALKTDFGYASANLQLDGWSDQATFLTCVLPALDAKSPVVLSIQGSSGGHMVLADGYGYSSGSICLHLNFGWCSGGDAWYCPPDLNVDTANHSYFFNVIDSCAYNIFPDRVGSILSGRVLDKSGHPVSGAMVALANGNVATTDSNGVYAFVEDVSAATVFTVTASVGVLSASTSATLSPCVCPVFSPETINGVTIRAYSYSIPPGSGTSGNSYGNDIVLNGLETTPSPVFNPGTCLFYPSTNVTITCPDSGASIYYTLDGSMPTTNSLRYTEPIDVDDTVTIQARAFSTGKNPSPVVAAIYTYDAAVGGPKGDFFATPIKISGMNGTYVVQDNSAYTIEANEPTHIPSYSYCSTIWFRWTAPGTGTIEFQAESDCEEWSYWFPFLAAYAGDSLSSINRLTYDIDEDDDGISVLSFFVNQGTEYRIVGMVYAGAPSPCSFALTWSGDLTVQKTPYETWADANGLGDDPGDVSGGVENAFRYVFDKPTESFSPILSALPGASGGSVLRLPTVVNEEGVTLKVLTTTDLTDWDSQDVSERTVTVGSDGTVVLPADGGPIRFFRLKAEVE